MVEVSLAVRSPEGFKQVALARDRLTIGRGESAGLPIEDHGLSRLHASIYREGDRVWILDEGSTNGSFVNRKLVPPSGTPLRDGDEIRICDTTILVSITAPGVVRKGEARKASTGLPGLLLAVGLPLIAIVLLGLVVVGSGILDRPGLPADTGVDPSARTDQGNTNASAINGPYERSSSTPEATPSIANANRAADDGSQLPAAKRYQQMTEDERTEFVSRQAQRIAMMMGNRRYAFTDDVLGYIKRYVDGYSRRIGTGSEGLWSEDLNLLFNRAVRYAPYIIRSFREEGVPVVVGLYLPVIECEYRACLTSPAGAQGLFQFMPGTARHYRVDPSDRCDAKKMAPAAARYMKDRIAEFGTDPMSVALGIAGYNRSPDSVRRDLHDVLNSDNKERSFWTLVANSDKLDRFFQNENVKYVPKFFAAAIVGENPAVFGLKMNALSSYSEVTDR